MSKQNVSPCVNCTRVADPKDCENKCCRVWSRWFLQRWEMIHGFYEKHKEELGNELEK